MGRKGLRHAREDVVGLHRGGRADGETSYDGSGTAVAMDPDGPQGDRPELYEASRMARGPPKPIGWTFDGSRRQEWEETVRRGAKSWTPNWDVYDTNAFVQTLIPYGGGSSKQRAAKSFTEDKITKDLQIKRRRGTSTPSTTALG